MRSAGSSSDMLELKDKNLDPPCGWSYHVAQTDFTIHGRTRAELIQNVVRHMEANDIATPDNLEALVDDSIARRCPSDLVKEVEV